ncbi:hypothetical protein D7X30_27420 [Corallococcus sp. AB011P]|uniref:hypothetical protein n=1 Tax=Corallococcus sp. AB011P TaxID=2316735 RepID=UPI000EA0110C|nr:hypothetical protein [Corallococcus sp. AB011P]RKG54900.1 hypothetical protein D7X30_27420 [Corallococcus sp. AB011P]
MGTFQQFLDSQKLSPAVLLRRSQQLEARTEEDRVLERKRSTRRRDKEQKPYAELGLGRPRSGRGLSEQQLTAAREDKPLSPRVRSKLVRAVNALLTKAGATAVDAKALFGDVPARVGPTVKKAAS